jgi:hypothetical protein
MSRIRTTEGHPRQKFWHINILGEHTNYKAKDIIGTITNLYGIYIFQIDKYEQFFFIVFFISLPTKL